MPRVIVSPRADRDIVAILDYLTQTAGPRVAGKYADAIDEAIARLEDMPGTAAPRPCLGRNIRITVVRPYLIIHEPARGTIRFTSCASYTADATSARTF